MSNIKVKKNRSADIARTKAMRRENYAKGLTQKKIFGKDGKAHWTWTKRVGRKK